MKNTLFTCSLGLAALLAGAAMAGDNPRSDAPHDSMHADTDGDGRVSRAEATAAGAARSGVVFVEHQGVRGAELEAILVAPGEGCGERQIVRLAVALVEVYRTERRIRPAEDVRVLR